MVVRISRCTLAACVLFALVALALLTAAVQPAGAAALASAGDAGWEWQNPLPLGDDYAAVEFADASHGWAVGKWGSIVATVDGGGTWTVQRSGTWVHLMDVCFVTAAEGHAVGLDGTVLSTVDGGDTWSARSIGVHAEFYSIDFADSRHGWAVGEKGRIMVTSDGGATWSPQVSGTAFPLYDVCFADAEHGWVVNGATIFATIDGGATWAAQSAPGSGLYRVAAVDADHAWVCGSGGVIVGTKDGGATWAKQIAGSAYTRYEGVSFDDAVHGWAVDSLGGVVRTGDGGATWSSVRSADGSPLTAVSFVSADRGWAVGIDGLIWATGDGGATWERQGSGPTDSLSSVSFVDADHGWGVGVSSRVTASSDGGAHWSSQRVTPFAFLADVQFVDLLHGWAVGSSGAIRVTGDGGVTWAAQAAGTGSGLLALSFVDASHGWAVGSGGTIVATSDGGARWNVQASGVTAELRAVQFRDASHGWAVGSGGTIVATSDGGATWSPQASGTTADLEGVSFPDAGHGWAVGAKGTVRVTNDGGASWTAQTSGSDLGLADVQFLDAGHGWIVAANAVLATQDGGSTWLLQDFRADGAGNDLSFVDAHHGWVVGGSGVVLVTTTGGFRRPEINVSAGAHGSVSPASGPVYYGEDATYTITPDEGCHVASLSVDGVAQDLRRTWTFNHVTAAHSIVATFAVDTFTISASAGPHGSITPGSGMVDYGSSPTYTVTADEGYHLASLNVDGVPVRRQSTWTFSRVSAAHSISATFAIDTCAIDVSVGPHGSIWPGSKPVVSGSSPVYAITPDEGYYVESLTVDGERQAPRQSWTFVDVSAPHTIAATFAFDVTPPVTTDDAPSTWTNGTVVIHLRAVDAGSGMAGGEARTEYSLDGGATWVKGATVTVAPDLVGHSSDGLRILYRSADASGNLEGARTCVARVDTLGPVTSGLPVRARRNRKATFAFTVGDPRPGSPATSTTTPLRIVIRRGHGPVLKTLTASRAYRTNADATYTWARCRLRAGTFVYTVYATDQAGNPQAVAGGGTLTVR